MHSWVDGCRLAAAGQVPQLDLYPNDATVTAWSHIKDHFFEKTGMHGHRHQS